MTKDGTTDQKDSSAEKQDASKGKQETSGTPAYTEKSQAKAVSDALATAGRTAKVFEKRETAMGVREQRNKDIEAKAETKLKERDEAELEAAEGDKDERSRIRRRQELRTGELTLKQEREKFAAEKVERQAEIDTANATQSEVRVGEIATQYDLKEEMLKDLGLDLDQLEKVAKVMSTKEGTGPDTGRTLGGGEITEQQRLDKLYPTMVKKS